jgi:hypothetical protein
MTLGLGLSPAGGPQNQPLKAYQRAPERIAQPRLNPPSVAELRCVIRWIKIPDNAIAAEFRERVADGHLN